MKNMHAQDCFIYVPAPHDGNALTHDLASGENAILSKDSYIDPQSGAWERIALAESLVVYAHVWDSEGCEQQEMVACS